MNIRILNSNILKIFACIFMFCDHLGYFVLPEVAWLRYVGRLALPIFAFFIAEGCKYTKNRLKYLTLMAVLGVVILAVQYAVTSISYGNILITFSFSLIIIFLLHNAMNFNQKYDKITSFLWLILAILMMIFVKLFTDNFEIDYGFVGVLLPVIIALSDLIKVPDKYLHICRLFATIIGLILLVLVLGDYQWYGLCALPMLLLYNGKRGRLKMKYFFYIFYPAHVALLNMITWL